MRHARSKLSGAQTEFVQVNALRFASDRRSSEQTFLGRSQNPQVGRMKCAAWAVNIGCDIRLELIQGACEEEDGRTGVARGPNVAAILAASLFEKFSDELISGQTKRRDRQQINTMAKANATTSRSKRSIILVDDHPIVRQGLAELINHEKDVFVSGTAENLHEALEKIGSLKPDLVVADISLKGGNDGIELLKNIKARYPKILVLMLSMHDESLYAVRALRAGAAGYIMKQEATEKVLTAIHQVLKGEIYLSQPMEKKLMQQLVGGGGVRTGSPIEDLSDRELQIFSLIGQGRSTRQIAEELHLSIKTVETHRAHIKEKLNLKSATELVQHAVQWRET